MMPALATRLRRGARHLLERGLGRERVARLAERLPYKHQTYCLVAWGTEVPEEAKQRVATSEFRLRDGTAADVDALEGEVLYDDCATYRAWMAEGQQLLVAEEAGRVVSYVWLDLARSITLENLPEYRVEIGPRAAYGHEAWTLPSHRGRSLRRLTHIAEILAGHRAGKRWVVAYQLREETLEAMLSNLARTGIPRADVIDVVHVFQGFGLRLTVHWRPRAPHHAARFVRASLWARHHAPSPQRPRTA